MNSVQSQEQKKKENSGDVSIIIYSTI